MWVKYQTVHYTGGINLFSGVNISPLSLSLSLCSRLLCGPHGARPAPGAASDPTVWGRGRPGVPIPVLPALHWSHHRRALLLLQPLWPRHLPTACLGKRSVFTRQVCWLLAVSLLVSCYEDQLKKERTPPPLLKCFLALKRNPWITGGEQHSAQPEGGYLAEDADKSSARSPGKCCSCSGCMKW